MQCVWHSMLQSVYITPSDFRLYPQSVGVEVCGISMYMYSVYTLFVHNYGAIMVQGVSIRPPCAHLPMYMKKCLHF